LSNAELIWIHSKAHGTSRFAPLETGFKKNLVDTFLFGLFLDAMGPWNDEGAYATRHVVAFGDRGCCAQVLYARVGA
jgi:hypothetical protein